jgi:5'-nucleotidase
VPASALDILLTNDDGFAAPGLQAMAEALTRAGHTVRVVAPETDQSGTSARISTSEFRLREESPGVHAVAGSPADAVWVALGVVLKDDLPDLVVSGANRGQNLGAVTHLSGTVGAAVMATLNGIPAIAVSTGLDFAEHAEGFPSTIAAYPQTARYVTRLIDALAHTAGAGPLLPPGVLLNINHPALPTESVRPAVWAEPGAGWGYAVRHVPGEAPGTLKLRFGADDTTIAEAQTNRDTARFRAGHITVSLLAVAGRDPDPVRADLARRLAGVVVP